MKACKRPLLALVLLALLAFSCTQKKSTEPEPKRLTIALAATKVSSSSVELSITANFNGSAWLWKNGYYLSEQVSLRIDTASTYIDRDVVSGTEYCYQAGGNYIFFGEIWSNLVCVTP